MSIIGVSAAAHAAGKDEQPAARAEHGHGEAGHDHGHGAGHRRHGNPDDLQAYMARLEDPERAAWQKPDAVVAALGLKSGQTVCDIGAGPGYFSLRLGRALGKTGHVFAVDVDPQILEVLRQRIVQTKADNVTPVLALDDDPLLPAGTCDVVLVVDTYHHFPDGVAYLRRLVGTLKAGGRIVNIDYHKRETPVGPSLGHRVAREDFVHQAEAAGLKLVAEPMFLPYQYFVVLEPTAP